MHKSVWVVLLVVPLATAQTTVLEDATGDTSVTVAGTAPGAATDPSSFDLISFSVDEDVNGFTFVLEVGQVDPENPTATDTGRMDVDFQHDDQRYRLRFMRDTTTGVNAFGCYLMAYESGRDGYVHREFLETAIDGQAETMTVTVPREWLLDRNGTSPVKGRSFELFQAFAANGNPFQFEGGPNAVQIRDAMPDDGYGDIPYDVQVGVSQSGHASLHADTPARASNGEKGTFVFYVEASNLDSDEDRFRLDVSGVPADWEITLPGASLRLDGNSTRTFPVLVSIPFAHQHGAYESFLLEMTSARDASAVGRVELGVRYLATPQPAGHHDRLWIHSRDVAAQGGFALQGDGSTRAYFNTLEEDEHDSDVGVPPDGGGLSFGRQAFVWDVYLEPGLEMGLDFDLNRTGEITVSFDTESPGLEAAFSGYLEHRRVRYDEDGDPAGIQRTTLATIPPTSPKALGTGTSFTAAMQPTRPADLVPFDPDASLILRLNLTTDDIGQVVGSEDIDPLLTGGQLNLPLNEYRDQVSDVFNSLAGLEFELISDQERSVNPGETVVFELLLHNRGAVDDVFVLRANGTNADWARLLGDHEIFVPTGSSRPVVVAVSPPSDAPHLDVADLIITAASRAEPTVQGNIQIVAVVDDVLDHEDESHRVPGLDDELRTKKKSPGLGILAGLALLAVALRRR